MGGFQLSKERLNSPPSPGQQVSLFNITAKKIEGEGFKWLPFSYDELWQGTLNEAKSNRIILKTDGIIIVFRSYLAKKT